MNEQVTSKTQIATKSDNLSVEIEHLDKMVNALAEKLNPVRAQKPPSTQGQLLKSSPDEILAPLAAYMHEKKVAVGRVNAILETLLTEVECKTTGVK
jgi:hypothetical protein